MKTFWVAQTQEAVIKHQHTSFKILTGQESGQIHNVCVSNKMLSIGVNCWRNPPRFTINWRVNKFDVHIICWYKYYRSVCWFLQSWWWHSGSVFPSPFWGGETREREPPAGVPGRDVTQHQRSIFTIKTRKNKWKGKWVVSFIVWLSQCHTKTSNCLHNNIIADIR